MPSRRLDAMTDALRRAAAEHRRRGRRRRSATRAGEVRSNHAQDATRRWSSGPRRTSARARCSRSCSRSGSRSTARADALDVYRALRATNPSPYMYLLRLPHPDGSTYDVVGSSPGGAGQGHGPAGHHPPDRRLPAAGQDARGRRCAWPRTCSPTPRSGPSTSCSSTSAATTSSGSAEPGTVDVVEFMDVRRYSHVIHIESTVVGDLVPRAARRTTCSSRLPGGHPVRRAQAAGDEPHRALRAEPPRGLRRGRRLPRLPRRPRHGHRDPHGRRQGRRRPRPGRRGHRRRLRAPPEFEECVNKAAAVLRAVATARGMVPSREAPASEARRRPGARPSSRSS